MNTKYLSWLSLGAAILFSLYAYFTQDESSTKQIKEPTQQAQVGVSHSQKSSNNQNGDTSKSDSKTNSAKKNVKSAADFNYDFVMSHDAIGQNRNAPVDYYMLALSWSPAFCESQIQKYGNQLPNSSKMQCGTKRKYGWIIHGLWAQNAKAVSVADHPRFCQGDLPAVDYAIIQQYLPESPSTALLQGEWEKHGACGFNSAKAYFAKQLELFKKLRLPNELLPRNELFRWVKQKNPQLKNVFMQASRSELFICYDLKWRPMDCPAR